MKLQYMITYVAENSVGTATGRIFLTLGQPIASQQEVERLDQLVKGHCDMTDVKTLFITNFILLGMFPEETP